MEDNNQLKLVKSLMDKNKETLNTHKAETFVEIETVKNTIMEELQKNASSVTDLQKNIDVMETKMQKGTLQTRATKRNTIKDAFVKNDFDKKLEVWSSKKGSNDVMFDVPIMENQIVIHDPNSFTAGDAPVVLPFRESGVDKPFIRPVTLSDLIAWGSMQGNHVDWIEQTSKAGGAATRLEGATMAQGDRGYTELSVKAKIMSEFMKITNESLRDVDFLTSEINDELLGDLRILVDDQLLSGDGTGANVLGLIPQATAFSNAGFATTKGVILPNEADVLRVAINQIIVGTSGRAFPSAVLMHPTDVAKIDLMKIADGRYIEVPYMSNDQLTVVRVPIVQNTGITQGTYLVGDFMKAKAFIRDALTIRVWDSNEDDPLFNRSTVTANVRLAFRVRTNDKLAFVKGVFATDITAITKT